MAALKCQLVDNQPLQKTTDLQGEQLVCARNQVTRLSESLSKLKEELRQARAELAGYNKSIEQHDRRMNELQQELASVLAMHNKVIHLQE